LAAREIAVASRTAEGVLLKDGSIFFAPKSFARLAAQRFKLVELPIKELTYTRRNIVSYRSDAYLPPAGHRFIAMLKATGEKLSEQAT
jgi:hypothetical protein